MRKIQYFRILAGLSLLGISLSCEVPFIQELQPATVTPTATASPTKTETPLPSPSLTETITPIPTGTEIVFVTPLATSTPKFAPFCEPSSASIATPVQCQIPIAEQSSSFCSSKVPYNLVLISSGSDYEVLTEDFSCTDSGTKDGKQLLTCTGPMLSDYELRVCDPSCAPPVFQPVVTNCPEDYFYNDVLGCCTQSQQLIGQNCVVLELQTKGCVTGCSEIRKQADCEKYFYSCAWDFENKVCLPR